MQNIYCIGKIEKDQMMFKVCENKSDVKKRISIIEVKAIRKKTILYGTRKINTPLDAVNLARKFLEHSDREKLILCCLDTKNQPVSISTISIGSLNMSVVHPREVFKAAILSNAASIILFHNHPSGDPTESEEDIQITKRIKQAGELLGINLLDHIIIGNDSYTSLKEKGVF